MTFPDGRIKDGLFENNVFKGAMPANYNETTKLSDTFLNSSINDDNMEARVKIKTRGKSNS